MDADKKPWLGTESRPGRSPSFTVYLPEVERLEPTTNLVVSKMIIFIDLGNSASAD